MRFWDAKQYCVVTNQSFTHCSGLGPNKHQNLMRFRNLYQYSSFYLSFFNVFLISKIKWIPVWAFCYSNLDSLSWNPWNLSFCQILFHELTHFLILTGSACTKYGRLRFPPLSYLVKCKWTIPAKIRKCVNSWNKT